MENFFRKVSARISTWVGTPWAFLTALGIIFMWAMLGPLFHWSNGWQLFVNTTTTIITFLMVFLIQNEQNRDNKTLHIKLDELLRALDDADDKNLARLEKKDDQTIRDAEARTEKLVSEC
jgi:low affinity Fe/Cu permease